MPIHVDAPASGDPIDPSSFRVRGWIWLESSQPQLDAVEILHRGTPLAVIAATELHERVDVTAHLRLPPGTRTGFDVAARVAPPLPPDGLELQLRARLRDGTHTPFLFAQRLASPKLEQHPFQMLLARVPADALGLEIGAHTNPAADLSPFYTDAVVDFAGSAGRVDFLSDARALPLPDDTLDYLVSSHVLEHLPDPLGALHEWHRVLRPGALLYLVVPDKRFTFDVPRAVTTTAHLLSDFQQGTTAADAVAHLDEFLFETDWSRLRPGLPAVERASFQATVRARYLEDLAQNRPIDIHYHTFTPDSLEAHLHAAGFLGGAAARFTVLARAERYPPGRGDGIALLLEKTGAPRPRPAPATFHLRNLPLVCPLTLAPLTFQAGEVLTSPSSARYSAGEGRPNLLPPPDAVAARPWTRRARPDSPTLPVLTSLRSHLDEPAPLATVDPLCFLVRGWVHLAERHGEFAAVEAWSGPQLIGETRALFERADVSAALDLAPGTRAGYELFAHHPGATPGEPLPIQIRVRLQDGTRTPVLFNSAATALTRDYRANHFGVLLDQRTTAVQRHGNIFATGPSQAEGSGELAHLLRRYLGAPPCRVIDVGCGLGSYGRGLLADGYDWLGAEVDAADCAELARLGLPHRHVDGRTLPFADGAFDAALCIEVLEHIDDPRSFLAEVRRVAPRRLIVSVPNCELLGYLYDHLATPWHMLEVTHVNFFTRWSLGTVLREFYPHVELRFHTPYPLRTVEGTPLHYNLLAIATAE